MAISRKDIDHLKHLARVEFGEKETESLSKDLGAILDYVDMLKEVDVTGIAETTHALDVKNIMRIDEVRGECDPEPIIEAFPENKGAYCKVKALFS
jgi:aspartyl-tRNA(Asn)/glutamyl-tRNA(Gln) amidotransferase subunit C